MTCIWPLRISLCSILLISQPLLARQAVAPTTQPSVLLQKALAALSGSVSVSDVTLTGTAERIAGSDDETGTVVVKALDSTGCRVDFNFPSGTRSEVYSTASGNPTGSWVGPDATSHPISLHNLWTDPNWMFPAFALADILNSSNYSFVYIGQESRDGQTVLHVSVWLLVAAPQANTATLIQQLSQTEIYLDPVSLLPVAMAFNTHPDNDAGLNIPVEIRYSDYQSEAGVQVPMHVQKYLNNGLVLDLQFQKAATNSGLPASLFVL
jgi:hypothetical protein